MSIDLQTDSTLSNSFSAERFELSLREIILLAIDKVGDDASEFRIHVLVQELVNAIPNMYVSQLTNVSISRQFIRGVIKKLVRHQVLKRNYYEAKKSYSIALTDAGQGELDFLIYKLALSEIRYLLQMTVQ